MVSANKPTFDRASGIGPSGVYVSTADCGLRPERLRRPDDCSRLGRADSTDPRATFDLMNSSLRSLLCGLKRRAE